MLVHMQVHYIHIDIICIKGVAKIFFGRGQKYSYVKVKQNARETRNNFFDLIFLLEVNVSMLETFYLLKFYIILVKIFYKGRI